MSFRKLIKRMAFCALMVCTVPILSSLAMGTLITYSDVSVGSLNFTNIQEDTTNTAVVKYGQPVGGGSFSFPTYVVNAFSVLGDGPNAGPNNTSFSTTITSPSAIQAIDFNQGGNYFLTSSGPPATFASIASTGSHLEVLAVNGVDLVTPILVLPTAGDFSIPTTLSGAGTLSGDWSGQLSFNLTGMNATKVSLVLNNVVNTGSNPTSVAFIGGARTSLNMLVTVPEPSSIALLGMGSLAIALTWIRKRNAR